jgi:hypothetical protein
MNKFHKNADQWVASTVKMLTDWDKSEIKLALEICNEVLNNWDSRKFWTLSAYNLYEHALKIFNSRRNTEKIVRDTSVNITIILS